jgi:homoserine O-acetyltransferase
MSSTSSQSVVHPLEGDKKKKAMDDEYGDMNDVVGHTYVHPGPFRLESGHILPQAQLRYMTYGTLNASRDNVLVVCHALTGNAQVHTWWGNMIGPGQALDTHKYYIVCANILGSCYGSTGPASPLENKVYGMTFPDISVQDTVRLQLHMLQDELKIHRIQSVIGGSFGGMQALEFAVQAGTPTSPFAIYDPILKQKVPWVQSVVPMACGAAHTAWQIAISEVQRQAIYADPKWNGGEPSMDDPPLAGLAVARQMGMISYRTPKAYETKFGRRVRMGVEETDSYSNVAYGTRAQWQVKSYLEYQGTKFLDRFDPVTYVKLTEQMDSHDIGRNRGGKKEALGHVKIPALVMGIDSDVLYPLWEQEELAMLLPNCTFKVIHSDAGHDGFLLEQEQVASHITHFLNALR